jgi:multidrug efflux pump subunit AcrB
MKDNKVKEFFLSSWAIDNRTAVYILTIIISLAGLLVYQSLPKEQFPEIKFPQIIVQTVYPGTSPENMENLVTKHIEKEVKNITGVKKVTSNSFQDYSVVIVEFRTDVKVDKAKRDVKDAVDKAKSDLPQNLPNEPEVKDIDVSEIPIMNVNISGNYDLNRLKKFADHLKDRIEEMKEIKRVNLVGALDREIQINVDLYKMAAAGLTFDDIERTVASENISTTAGEVAMNHQKRILTVRNEFKNMDDLKTIVVKNAQGSSVYLRDIADIQDSFEEQESYARLDGKNVITLNVIKASGENLINASDKIEKLVEEMKKTEFPKDLSIVTTGDQSEKTRSTLHDLVNTIIIGFILVTVILMFFMGVTNALFVALSVPLSCAVAFLVMPAIHFNLNMIVLFSFLLALGIVVDDAIVVIENTHRIFGNGRVPIKRAAKIATGEVFLPVLTGTLTTLMPFIPLAFWNSVIGSFMFFLPITLIITLIASLLVAYVINPVFAVDFMKPHNPKDDGRRRFKKRDRILLIIFASLALLCYATRSWGMGNFIVFIYLFILLEKFVFERWIHSFQNKAWPAFQAWYTRWLQRALRRPWATMGITAGILAGTIMINSALPLKSVFFPSGDPNFTYVYLNMPVGTDQAYTNTVLTRLENQVSQALIDPKTGKITPIVKSIIANVTVDAVDPSSGEVGNFPNKGRITVAFKEFSERHGVSSADYMERIRRVVNGIPGAVVTVDKEQGGPPLAKPIVIDITGDNLDSLIVTSEKLKRFIKSKQIPGVEELRSDFQANKPEIVFDLDRERMNSNSINTGQVAAGLRTAVFGKEVSRFRDENDDYPITLRLAKAQREEVSAIQNMPITFRDMGLGGAIRTVPVSSFANVRYATTYGGIKRKDQKRIISLSSNVIGGFNEQEVVQAVQRELNGFPVPADMTIKMGGQQEDQAETVGFLANAMLISICLIFLLLIIQFNSFSRTLIIMAEIIFSWFGVFLGMSIFRTTFSFVMSGIGMVALAGIVVRNGILLVEFMDLMLKDGMSPIEAIIESGRTRMTPVILTATAAILGLIPLAVGLNIDFASLFSELNPHIYFGGDSQVFWGPLAWTMIYGLSFATFLTLIVVPVMCLISFRIKGWLNRKLGWGGKKWEMVRADRRDMDRDAEHKPIPVELN